MTTGLMPASFRARTTCAPMYPAPPVINQALTKGLTGETFIGLDVFRTRLLHDVIG